jgi:hypothetical protein
MYLEIFLEIFVAALEISSRFEDLEVFEELADCFLALGLDSFSV